MTFDIDVPFFSIKMQHAAVDLLIPIQRVLNSHRYVLGEEVTDFEKEFASYVGVEYCITVGNGTDALELSLRAAGIKSGDWVLLAANAGFYGSAVLHLIGAIPYYVDIDPITLTLSAEKIQEAFKVKPKAVIVTHLYGQLADVETICDMASKKSIPVIEDCAQAHGAKRQGKCAGSFGKLGCFSFYPTKNLGAIGDGGAVVTDDKLLFEKLKSLRQYGWAQKYHVDIPCGRNSRLDEMQAAILREKLPYLDGWNDERRLIAGRYNQAFLKLPMRLPNSLGEDNVVHLYVLRIENRDGFKQYLQQQGIQTDIHYPIPDYSQSAYTSSQAALDATESACAQVISLPCYPGLSKQHQDKIISCVLNYFENVKGHTFENTCNI